MKPITDQQIDRLLVDLHHDLEAIEHEVVEPTITVTRRDDLIVHFHIEGGTIDPGWARGLRPGRKAECDFTIWRASLDTDRVQLGSFGGEVWPSAWPHLFESHRGTAQSGPFTTLTPLGLRAVLRAFVETDSPTSLSESSGRDVECTKDKP
jgi:hypothetical protein